MAVWALPLLATKLSPGSLTAVLNVPGIRILIGFGNSEKPLVHSVIYHPGGPHDASPKAISKRTSYHGI